MESPQLSVSIYRRFLAAFVRTPGGLLVHCTGPSQHTIQASWHKIQAQLSSSESLSSEPSRASRVVLSVEPETEPAPGGGDAAASQSLVVMEKSRASTDDVFGILLTGDGAPNEVEGFFGSLILNGIELDIQHRDRCNDTSTQLRGTTDAIVDHFDRALRYVCFEDKWNAGGRDYFRDRVQHFVSRGKMVEFCLPAFPCKSTNPDKVQGILPDRGEYIALMNLHRFVEGIERIYEPGAKLWIISDGHVFSDCNDIAVEKYGARLIAMNEAIAELQGRRDRVGFKSLVDIFALGTSEAKMPTELGIPQIPHHISTDMVEESELCRRILMMGFCSDGDVLRKRIDAGDPAILALYRGFSKFMLEDLDLNVYTKDLSRTQRRKLSAKVAFEMIQRNQAYSNLVEVLFPHHIRLSIHAHPNSGPKFGIQLFGEGVRATKILSPDGRLMQSQHFLHVPTPWHNCVVEIEGHATLYVTKSSIARSALSSGKFTGRLAGAPGDTGRYYHLTTAPSNLQESSDSATEEAASTTDCSGAATERASASEERQRAISFFRTLGLLRGMLTSLWNFATSCFTSKPRHKPTSYNKSHI